MNRSAGRTRGALSLLLALAAGAAAGEARAAVGDLTALSIEQLMQVEVRSASKFRQQSVEAPAAVSVVTADEIRDFGYRTLAEIIASLRGVYVSNDRYFSYVGVRGFARAGDYNSRILLLVDGIRQNDSVYNQAMVGTESPLDVDLIERVEFVPGAGSSVYGANAFFGVLNVITKNGGDYRGSEAALAAGSYGTGKLRLTHGEASAGGGEWLVSGSAYRQRGQDHTYPAHGGRADDLDGDRSGSLFAKLRTPELTLGLMVGKRTKENPTASFGQVFNARGSESVDESAALSGEFHKALSAALALTVRGYAQQYRYRGDFIYDAPPLYTNRDEAEGRMWGGEAQFTSTHFRGHRIVFGAEYRHDGEARQKNFDVAPYVSFLDSRVSETTRGLYVQDEIALGERVLVNVGVRHDHLSNAPAATSPRLGLIYKPLPQTALKLLYGEAYRPPNAFEFHYATDTVGGYRANPDLDPERIRSRELVLEHALTPAQRVVASLYRNDVKDLIAQQYDAVADRFYFDNLSSVRAKGLELEWSGRFAGGVMVRVGASWQRAEDEASGSRLSNSPARLFKANLSAPLWGERLRAGLEVQAMSSRKTELGTAAPGFAIANLTLQVPRLAKDVDLSASIYNLFDRRYYDPAGAELDPIDRVEQNGRNFRLKLNCRF